MQSQPLICDWTTGSHRYSEPVQPFESGRTIKVSPEGVIDWEKRDWHQIRCPSSETSVRINCDGQRVRFMGNIGRFRQPDNITGIGVVECVEKWAEVIKGFDLPLDMFGTIRGKGTIYESGTTFSRLDLAGNFDVSDYYAWCQQLMLRPIGRKHPVMGKYGPTWGYDTKRANWWRAKVYDKAAEAAGLRNSRGGQTRARFEVQLGGEYLKREGLQYVEAWSAATNGGKDMAQIIYGRFRDELLKQAASVNDWSDIPARLRGLAIAWRDGACLKSELTYATFYRNRKALLQYGIDIGVPCNVVALSRRVREVEILQVSAARDAA